MIRKSDVVKSTIIAIITILICIGIVTAGTLALFTDSMLVENHLEAGTLDVTLTRTHLEKKGLDKDGILTKGYVAYPDDVPFTGENTENVLGLAVNEKIVPGLDCKATLAIAHGPTSNIAFDYTVKLVVKGDENGLMNALGEQLVFYAIIDGVTYEKTLSEMGLNEFVLATGGPVAVSDISEEFIIGVKFIDHDAGPNADKVLGETNNKAQSQNFYFDIVVTAVQATHK